MKDTSSVTAIQDIDADTWAYLQHIRPINRHILGIRCIGDHFRDENGEIILHKTEKTLDTSLWAEVIMVASDCKTFPIELLREYRVWMKFPFAHRFAHWFRKNVCLVHESVMDEKCPSLAPFVVLEPRNC